MSVWYAVIICPAFDVGSDPAGQLSDSLKLFGFNSENPRLITAC